MSSDDAWDRFARMEFYLAVALSLFVLIGLQVEQTTGTQPFSDGLVVIVVVLAGVSFILSIGTLSIRLFQQGMTSAKSTEAGA